MPNTPDSLFLTKRSLADYAVAQGWITSEQLSAAWKSQKETGKKLSSVLMDGGWIQEDQWLTFLAHRYRMPYVDLRYYPYRTDLMEVITLQKAKRHRALLLDQVGRDQDYVLGLVDPSDLMAQDELVRFLKKRVRFAVIAESAFNQMVSLSDREGESISALASALGDSLESDAEDDDGVVDDDAPVVKLLSNIFEEAVRVEASDIHIEPDEGVLRIRNRVDGVLQEQLMQEKRIVPALVLKLKLMSRLNISEKRLPQDGRFHIKIFDKDFDVRLSTMPIQHGESVVMRLLDRSKVGLRLDDLQMRPVHLDCLKRNITRPHGMILVTGPTGSGKTTSLYACLAELNYPDRKIITVEDPVEYSLPRVNQVQVKAAIDLTFGKVLRSALRQDPDVVMVGEIRDQETAEIAMKAAMTGHLVFSTLHTNDAVTSALRLIDMGTEGYMVASALRLIIGQRLIRRICLDCKQPYQPPEQVWSYLCALVGEEARSHTYYAGRGCERCHQTGYRGRLGIHEMLEMTGELADALRVGDTVLFARVARNSPHFRPLAMAAYDYAVDGVTTVDEVLRMITALEETAPSETAVTQDASSDAVTSLEE